MSVTEEMMIDVPSSPEDRQKLKGFYQQFCDAKVRAKAETDHMSDIIKKIHEEFGINKKSARSLAMVIYRQNINSLVSQTNEIENAYSVLYSVPQAVVTDDE